MRITFGMVKLRSWSRKVNCDSFISFVALLILIGDRLSLARKILIFEKEQDVICSRAVVGTTRRCILDSRELFRFDRWGRQIVRDGDQKSASRCLLRRSHYSTLWLKSNVSKGQIVAGVSSAISLTAIELRTSYLNAISSTHRTK